MCRRLLIARGSVELTCAVQTLDAFKFKCAFKLCRVDAIVLDGVGKSHYLSVFEPLDRVEHLKLYLGGKGRGKSLKIDLVGIVAHRLGKKLMSWLVGKSHHLVLNARAVAWARALDHTAVKRRAVEIVTNDLMCFFVGVRNVAGD